MNEENGKYVVGIISAPHERAEYIAKEIVSEKLAACVQILGPISSFYWWNNGVQKDTEALILLKTKQNCIEVIKHRLKFIHPYDIPELIFLPVVDGLKDYLEWIDNTVDKK